MNRKTFTSRSLPAHLSDKTRVARWQELWGDEVGACDIAAIPDRPFEARADVAWFDEVVVAQVDATTSHYVRTAAQAAADKHDYLYMGFNRSPRPVWVRHCGRDSVIHAGEMLIWSNTVAFERREQDRVSGHMIGFDRARLAALAPEIEDAVAARSRSIRPPCGTCRAMPISCCAAANRPCRRPSASASAPC